VDIDRNLKAYLGAREPTARYTSFDYCFNHFQSHHDLGFAELASASGMELSCLHLGFYLASWGMLRGSSVLLRRSIKHFTPVIEVIAAAEMNIWEIDAHTYTDESRMEALPGPGRGLGSRVPRGGARGRAVLGRLRLADGTAAGRSPLRRPPRRGVPLDRDGSDAIGLVLMVILAATRTQGWRIVAWLTGIGAEVYGASSIAFRSFQGSGFPYPSSEGFGLGDARDPVGARHHRARRTPCTGGVINGRQREAEGIRRGRHRAGARSAWAGSRGDVEPGHRGPVFVTYRTVEAHISANFHKARSWRVARPAPSCAGRAHIRASLTVKAC
jgi:hypothetical protein